MKIFSIPLLALLLLISSFSLTTGRVTYVSQKLDRLLEEIPGDTRFEFNVQTHNMYYKRIVENLTSIEKAYIDCLDSLSNNNYNEETVDKCVGKDMVYVINDMEYERRQIIGRADDKIRGYMIEFCYNAAVNEDGANDCDLLERDSLELLWNQLNFGALIDYHKSKYIEKAAKVPLTTFDKTVAYFHNLYTELNDLLDEIDDHNIIVRANIKKAIDMRTRVILEQARENVRNPKPKIITHSIEIEETINNPNYFYVDNLPRPTVRDGTRTMYALNNNPEVEEFHQKYDSIIANEDIEGPTITLPERRLSLESDSRID